MAILMEEYLSQVGQREEAVLKLFFPRQKGGSIFSQLREMMTDGTKSISQNNLRYYEKIYTFFISIQKHLYYGLYNLGEKLYQLKI